MIRLPGDTHFQTVAQHSVHPTGGSRRVFGQFARLGVGSGKMELPHPAHQRVTQTVGQFLANRDMKNQTLIASVIAILIVSCVPAKPSAPTQTSTMLETTPTPTPIIITPINTASPIPTPTFLPLLTPTATNTQRPFLISYTYYSDGGDDLSTCLQGVARPLFILYEDGELIVLRNGYKHTTLSQNEINVLLNNIEATGLFERSEKEYSEGRDELMINGKRYYLAFDTPHSDPLWKVFDIVINFQPENLSRYTPENLLLEIYQIDELKSIERFFPQPTPDIQNWKKSPLHEFGEVWQTISGENVPKVIDQFNNFPDFRIFQEGNKYYVASICGSFPFP